MTTVSFPPLPSQDESEKETSARHHHDDDDKGDQHDDCCSSCNGEVQNDADNMNPRKKPKVWAHHLLRVVSPPPKGGPLSPPSVISDCEKNDDGHVDKDQEEEDITQQAIVFLEDPSDLADAIFSDTQLAVWRRPTLPRFVETLSSSKLDQSKLPSYYGIVTPDSCVELMSQALLPKNVESALSRAERQELIDDIHKLVTIFHAIITDESEDEGRDEGEKKEKAKEPEQQQPEGVHVRLECLDSNGCEFFHQDTVPLRMVTTYRGPCTEYVDPKFSETTLRNRQKDSPHAQSLTHYDVALFKGRVFDEEYLQDDDNQIGAAKEKDVQVESRNDPTETTNANKTAENDDQESRTSALTDSFDNNENTEEDLPDLTSPGIVHRSPRIEGSDVVRLVLVLDIPADFHSDGEESDTDDDEDDDRGKTSKPEESDVLQ